MKDDVLDRLAVAWAGISPPYRPPDWSGDPGPGLVVLTGAPRELLWRAVVSASAPDLEGSEQRFAVTKDGRIVIADSIPTKAVEPLVAAIENEIDPPFCAVAVQDEGDVWVAAANPAEIVDLVDVPGQTIEVSNVARITTTRIDGADSDYRFPQLEDLIDGDGALVAHRFTGDTWIAEVFPL